MNQQQYYTLSFIQIYIIAYLKLAFSRNYNINMSESQTIMVKTIIFYLKRITTWMS